MDAFRHLSAFRYRWVVPAEGVVVLRQRRPDTGGTTRLTRGGGEGVLVLAPRDLERARFSDFAWPDQREGAGRERRESAATREGRGLSQLKRDLELVDARIAAALADLASRWGFPLTGRFPRSWGTDSYTYGSPEGTVPGALRTGVLTESLDDVRREVRIYQYTVQRLADLKKLSKREAEVKRSGLRDLMRNRLERLGGTERDPETFLPLIPSPLAAAWQYLAESVAGGLVPLRCDNCNRAFTPSAVDKRTDRPPTYCSSRCRLAAWRKRQMSTPKKKAPRSGRGRK